MNVIVKRFGGDERHINLSFIFPPRVGDSLLVEETDNAFTSSQVREFLNEGESPCFKVKEVMWRLGKEPIIYIENAF